MKFPFAKLTLHRTGLLPVAVVLLDAGTEADPGMLLWLLPLFRGRRRNRHHRSTAGLDLSNQVHQVHAQQHHRVQNPAQAGKLEGG